MGSWILFGLVAIVCIVAALQMILAQNAVHSALWLVLIFSATAVLYIILNAPFTAMVQITVYAGAIVVLFLFVIMLLGAERLGGLAAGAPFQRNMAIGLAVILVVVFATVLLQGNALSAETAVAAIDTSPSELGFLLFGSYVLPFQVTGILLITAIIGVVVLSRNFKTGKKNG